MCVWAIINRRSALCLHYTENSLIEYKKPELQPAEFTPLNVIRTETVLSRLPIHNLAKRGNVNIHIVRKNVRGGTFSPVGYFL